MEIIPKEVVENPFSLLPGYGCVGQVHGHRDAAVLAEGEIGEAALAPSECKPATTVYLDENGRRIGAKRLARLYPAAGMITETIRRAGSDGEENERPEMALAVCHDGNTRYCDAAGQAAVAAPLAAENREVRMSGFRREATTVYYDAKGKTLTEEEYLSAQAPADLIVSRHNAGDSLYIAGDGASADPPQTPAVPARENSVVWLL